MTIDEYLAALDDKLHNMEGIIATRTIERQIDTNLDIGFIQGRITFIDGSVLDFSEQLPTQRARFRFHYMSAQTDLIARWDSAPHHPNLDTFPFHKHTTRGVEKHRL